ncbi:hypothetical protein BU23DRAFT_49072 [Bimuria novae-zelandiae CBS 107.79]|uniref:Uncharacterized protein n=1 Tax=Bimuria novae-zelandiae CBS 107.79 TaxID=1447943 RepID=A0A6A5UPL6_9PLEO|nr:hypothetical protein BU23DRAFT_49072 [Bimuria novae-zelandiae CBS 107.79]
MYALSLRIKAQALVGRGNLRGIYKTDVGDKHEADALHVVDPSQSAMEAEFSIGPLLYGWDTTVLLRAWYEHLSMMRSPGNLPSCKGSTRRVVRLNRHVFFNYAFLLYYTLTRGCQIPSVLTPSRASSRAQLRSPSVHNTLQTVTDRLIFRYFACRFFLLLPLVRICSAPDISDRATV